MSVGQILEPLSVGKGNQGRMHLHRASLGGATRRSCAEAACDVSGASFVMHPQCLPPALWDSSLPAPVAVCASA